MRDQQGFADFAAARAGDLRRQAYLLTGSPERAVRLTDKALADTGRRWDRLGGADAAEEHARRVVAAGSLRGRGTAPAFSLTARGTAAATDDTGEAVRRALAGLPPRRRAVLVLRYDEGLDNAAVGARLGVPPAKAEADGEAGLITLRSLLRRRGRPEDLLPAALAETPLPAVTQVPLRPARPPLGPPAVSAAPAGAARTAADPRVGPGRAPGCGQRPVRPPSVPGCGRSGRGRPTGGSGPERPPSPRVRPAPAGRSPGVRPARPESPRVRPGKRPVAAGAAEGTRVRPARPRGAAAAGAAAGRRGPPRRSARGSVTPALPPALRRAVPPRARPPRQTGAAAVGRAAAGPAGLRSALPPRRPTAGRVAAGRAARRGAVPRRGAGSARRRRGQWRRRGAAGAGR